MIHHLKYVPLGDSHGYPTQSWLSPKRLIGWLLPHEKSVTAMSHRVVTFLDDWNVGEVLPLANL